RLLTRTKTLRWPPPPHKASSSAPHSRFAISSPIRRSLRRSASDTHVYSRRSDYVELRDSHTARLAMASYGSYARYGGGYGDSALNPGVAVTVHLIRRRWSAHEQQLESPP